MSSLSFHDIGLKPSMLRAVEKKARDEGKSPPEYLRSLIERDLLASKSFDEILKPIREGFSNAGVTEKQLDSLVTKARKDIHSRRKRKARR